MSKGYFKQEGINLDFTILQSGSTTTQAMASGSIDMVTAGALDMAAAVAKGYKLTAIASGPALTIEYCYTKALAQAHGLSAKSNYKTVLDALKGKTFGITQPNGAPDLLNRYLLQKYTNLQPGSDVKVVALGSTAAELTAMQKGQIDAFAQSPPNCEAAIQAGVAVPVLRTHTIKQLADLPQGVYFSQNSWLQSHKSVATKVATALAKGNNFARTNTDASIKILAKYFPKMDANLLRTAYLQVVAPALLKDAKMSQAGWQQVNEVLVAGGVIKKGIPTKEGGSWTNSYIKLGT
jgi:NitT/TauT family transport system substrate-binding protein